LPRRFAPRNDNSALTWYSIYSFKKKLNMNKVYVLDRYTSKNLEIVGMKPEAFAQLKVGDKIVYSAQDQT